MKSFIDIEQVEIIKRVVDEDADGFEQSERKEWKFDHMSQVDVELTGTQGNSVWFSGDQELFAREDADAGWRRGIVLPELRRACVSLGMLTVRTNHKTVENMVLDGLGRLLDFKAEEIINTPDFPSGKDSDDIYMEGAGIVAEVLHCVTNYITTLQEENVDVTDLVDQCHTLFENVHGWERKHESERESA